MDCDLHCKNPASVAHRFSIALVQVFLVFAASVVGFISVLVGRWLQLDYSAKLYVMTFVLVVMAAEHSSGVRCDLSRRDMSCLTASLFGHLVTLVYLSASLHCG